MVRLAQAAVVGALIGCSGMTDVSRPSNLIDQSELQSISAATAMYTGAVFQFGWAFGGQYGTTSYIPVSGLFSDEFTTSVNGSAANIDSHVALPTDLNGSTPYENLHGARRSADAALKALLAHREEVPGSLIAEVYALKGYIYVLMSEMFCSGVPFGSFESTGAVKYTDGISQTEMLERAVALFDSAGSFVGDSARIKALVAVGMGRAYADLNDFAKAKAAVATVPTNFVYSFTYGASAWSNYLSSLVTSNYGMYAIADREGGNGLNYRTAGDPRLVISMASGSALPAKFPNGSASLPLADGLEARLIEAEAALRDHDNPGFATALNTLRSTGLTTPMPALTADSTTGAANDSVRTDVLFRERAFWLFATGRRAGDMRRLVRQYQRNPIAVYPAGVTTSYAPLVYMPTPNLPVPSGEATNNPAYSGCIDRNA